MAKKKKAKKKRVAKASQPLPSDSPEDPDEFALEVLDAEAGKQIVRNKCNGRFGKGTKAGGRPQGSVDGIALVRALFDRHIGRMSADGKEFDQLLDELKKTKGGVYRLFKMGLRAAAEQERAAASGNTVNVQSARAINIVIVEETPPTMKQIESHVVVEDGDNGKAD